MMNENKSFKVFSNINNATLGPMSANGLVIGYVDEVNGDGGQEIPGFIPTKNELLQTMKYWASRRLENDWFFFNTGNTGSSEWRLEVFASRRISQIASIIGEEDTCQAIDEVYAEFRESESDNMKLWQIFRKGTKAEWDKVLEEYDRYVCADQESTDKWAFAPNIVLTSPSVIEGHSIPDIYTDAGLNVSPPLVWSSVPSGTKSLAIVMDDLDPKIFNYWIMFNIPPELREVPEGVPAQGQLADGAMQGKNSYMKIGYQGPHKSSPFHRYIFYIYALDQRLDLGAGISRNMLFDAMEGHVLDEGNLTAIYG
jgi:hypothetical protein